MPPYHLLLAWLRFCSKCLIIFLSWLFVIRLWFIDLSTYLQIIRSAVQLVWVKHKRVYSYVSMLASLNGFLLPIDYMCIPSVLCLRRANDSRALSGVIFIDTERTFSAPRLEIYTFYAHLLIDQTRRDCSNATANCHFVISFRFYFKSYQSEVDLLVSAKNFYRSINLFIYQ